MMEIKILGSKHWYAPGKHYTEDRFWKRRGLYRNFRNGFEASNSFGLALGVSDLGEHRTLNVHLIWPNMFFKLGPAPETDFGQDHIAWGFSFFEGNLHINWARKFKIIYKPWGMKHLRTEYLTQDHQWKEGWQGDGDEWKALSVPFSYQSRSCDKQTGTAEITVRRMVRRGKLLWFRRLKKISIEVKFDIEVGSEAGSWKGGTIGCSYDLKPGESPLECFRRMMRERSFDRN